jgi:hypothetical protein
MDLSQLNPLSMATFAMSATALLMSTLAMFPSLRNLLAVFRDAVLWIAMFFVLGGGVFMVWNTMQRRPTVAGPTVGTQTAANQPTTPGFTYEPGRQ